MVCHMEVLVYDILSKHRGGGTKVTYGSHIAILLVLLADTRNGHEKHDDPRDADLEPHIKIVRTNAGVQASAHVASGHTDAVTGGDGDEVHVHEGGARRSRQPW